jgi:hypothetical protein
VFLFSMDASKRLRFSHERLTRGVCDLEWPMSGLLLALKPGFCFAHAFHGPAVAGQGLRVRDLLFGEYPLCPVT